MICRKCGKENNENLTFCKNCGILLKDGVKICRFCNEVIDDDSLFCGHCGKALREDIDIHFSIPSWGSIFSVSFDKNDKSSTYENVLEFLKRKYMRTLSDENFKSIKFASYDDRGRRIIFRDNASFDSNKRFNSDRLDEFFFDGAKIIIIFDEE